MNEKSLVIQGELEGLSRSKAKEIENTFNPMVKMLEGFEGQYAEVMAQEQSPEKCKQAKRLRLDIAKIRIEADKERRALKEEHIRAGKAIQGVYNILEYAVKDKENALKDIETYYERIEAEKIAKIQTERQAALMDLEVDGSAMDLGNMADDVWANFLAGTKTNYENKKAAERKAEEERAEAERKERVFRERKDALAPYARYGAFDHISLDDSEEDFQSLLAHMKETDRKAGEEAERVRQENERLRKEQEEREAAEMAEKEAAEKAKAAPDREKLAGWADSLEARLIDLDTEEAKTAVREAVATLRAAAAVHEVAA